MCVLALHDGLANRLTDIWSSCDMGYKIWLYWRSCCRKSCLMFFSSKPLISWIFLWKIESLVRREDFQDSDELKCSYRIWYPWNRCFTLKTDTLDNEIKGMHGNERSNPSIRTLYHWTCYIMIEMRDSIFATGPSIENICDTEIQKWMSNWFSYMLWIFAKITINWISFR